MLNSLQIQNYVLIQNLNLSLNNGFNTITGETGAGKSILLGALGLLLGNRADVKALLKSDQKCIVEGTFAITNYDLQELFSTLDLDYDDETIIRREINPKGKSRAFINDLPVTLDTLKTVTNRLIDIHSQHETLLINKSEFQTRLIDSYTQSTSLKFEFTQIYNELQQLGNQLATLISEQKENKKEQDYLEFLLNELEDANIETGELEKLNERAKLLEHTEEIKENISKAHLSLTNDEFSIINSLRDVAHYIQAVEKFSSPLEEISKRLSSSFIELDDIANELSFQNDKLEYNPNLVEEVRERLNLLNQLCQKHSVNNSDDLLEIKTDIEAKLTSYNSNDNLISSLEVKVKETQQKAQTTATQLFEKRGLTLKNIETEIQAIVSDLGMPDAQFIIEHQKTEDLTANGYSKFNFLFSANKGIPPQALQKVASGGEFSRLMFSIKYILAQKTSLPTLIFDEIDTGISGETAIKMADRMAKMSKQHQTIAITHLPQIAAKGNAHYFVYKDKSASTTQSLIKPLSELDRVEEIAKMIGGEQYTEAALLSAKELVTSNLS